MLAFHFEKTGGKDFWQCITRDEIITDYKTKAVMMHTSEGTTIVTQQEKVTNAQLCRNYNLYTLPGGGTPIYGLYRYVLRNRVWFLRFSVLK